LAISHDYSSKKSENVILFFFQHIAIVKIWTEIWTLVLVVIDY